jgi:hypothetical protein
MSIETASPSRTARAYALFFLTTLICGIIAQGVIAERLIAGGDAAKTAANILANGGLYRAGFSLYMIEMLAQITQALLLYELLKPVNRTVARVAVVFGVTGCGIKIFARLFYYAPLLFLASPAMMADGSAQSLSMAMLKLNDQGAAMALLIFGFGTLLEGWLLLHATFVPRFIGVLAVLGGLCWLTFLWPPLGMQLFMVSALIGLVGSVVTIGWFLIRGVDDERWREQARLAV